MNNENILVTGAAGQVGSEIRKIVLAHSKYLMFNNFYFTRSDTLNLNNYKAIEDFCKEKDIKYIINCAAYTAVDRAEEDRENANKINHLAVKI